MEVYEKNLRIGAGIWCDNCKKIMTGEVLEVKALAMNKEGLTEFQKVRFERCIKCHYTGMTGAIEDNEFNDKSLENIRISDVM